jgi:Haem-NO-binding
VEELDMMGHINNLLIRMVEKHHGSKGVLRFFELAGIAGKQYQPEIVYPEEEYQALYKAAKEIYGVGDEAAQKAFSDFFMEVSPVMFPAIFKVAGNTRSLFEKIPTIHKQWPAAVSAKDFREKLYVLESRKERLVFKYDSPNHLCGVLRFEAEGVLAYYREKGTVTETKRALKGAPWCEIEVCFETP